MRKSTFVLLCVIMSVPVMAASPDAMSDENLLAAYRVCIEAQTAGGGTLAGNPEMATLCSPIIRESERRRKVAKEKSKSESVEKLKQLLK